jgi:hypothetical protein
MLAGGNECAHLTCAGIALRSQFAATQCQAGLSHGHTWPTIGSEWGNRLAARVYRALQHLLIRQYQFADAMQMDSDVTSKWPRRAYDGIPDMLHSIDG